MLKNNFQKNFETKFLPVSRAKLGAYKIIARNNIYNKYERRKNQFDVYVRYRNMCIIIGLFQIRNCNPSVLRISMENSRVVEQKSLEFQGVHQKLRKRCGFPGVTENLTRNPGQLQKKMIISSTGGGGVKLFLEKPI